MKVFKAEYDETWRYGGYEEITLIIVANSESEALGFALEAYPKKGNLWSIDEVETTKPSVEVILERSS